MRPQTGRSRASYCGISASGIAWFYSWDCGFLFYDAHRESLVSRLPTPSATGFNNEPIRSLYDTLPIPSADRRHVYLLIKHGARSIDLLVVSVDEQNVVATYPDLPGSGWILDSVLDGAGHLLISSSIRTETSAGTGLVRLDPRTGAIETSRCDDSPVRGRLRSPSPGGLYWLRTDDSRLPMIEARPSFLQVSGLSSKRAERFFGLCHEIWQAFPLRRLHSVTSMWMTAEEMPDKGHYDSKTRQEGRPAKRGEIFRQISQFLAQHEAATMDRLFLKGASDVWPDETFFERQIASNAGALSLRHDDVAGWQPDGEAVWIKRHGFVSCVGVDGTVSPKIMLERYGYAQATWMPAAVTPRKFLPLANRRADMVFPDGTVTVSGHAEPTTPNIRTIPISEDHWRENLPDATAERDAKRAERAEKMAKKLSKYVATLASFSESDCIRAIEEITAQICPETEQHAYDYQLQAVFKHDRRRLNEKAFFTHVLKNCPGAAGALRKLIETFCDQVHPNAELYWQPEEGIGVFAHAALCLAKLEPSSIALLRRYGETVDTYHEYFFMGQTLPVMMGHLGTSVEMLDLAEWAFFNKLGNCAEASSFWRGTGMRKAAQRLFSPEAYAVRLSQKGKEWPVRSETTIAYGHALLDRLHWEIKDGLTDWERALFEALSTA